MKKMNRKYLLSTLIMFTFAIICGYIILFVDNSLRYFIGCGIAELSGIVSLTLIKSKEPLIGEPSDERDQMNISKSSRKAVNY